MNKTNLPKEYITPLLESAIQRLSAADITLQISKKRVKNINFRLKPYQLTVSVPLTLTAIQIAQFIDKRIPWAIDNHVKLLAQHQRKHKREQLSGSGSPAVLAPVMLWGKPQSFTLNIDEKTIYYRQQLAKVTPLLFAKWQPIVGAEANEVRFKKMHTRWGSCNTRARRIWLSVYLPAYPIECTEYVIVHELCHLYHPNHSRAFWQTVESNMSDYKHWHDMLAGKSIRID